MHVHLFFLFPNLFPAWLPVAPTHTPTPTPHTHPQYVLLKFLASDKEGVERVGVHCVKVCGHKILSDGHGIDSFLEKLVGGCSVE